MAAPARLAAAAAAAVLFAPGFAAAEPAPAEEARLAAESLLLDGAAAGARTIVVGERGHILFSDDDGARWTQARVPVRVPLTAIHMRDARTGWAVGHDAAILRTRDGGETWSLAHYAPEMRAPLLDVWFRDENHGIAVGGFGLFLATADGGANWRCRNGCPDGGGETPLLRAPGADFADDFHLNAIAAAGPDRLFLAGEAGALYRSDDGGETWRALDSPYHGSWFGALALDADTLVVAGLRGRLFRSADAGAGWTRVETETNATLADIARAGPDLILVAGLGGALFASRDGARGVAPLPAPSRRGLTTVLATPGGAVLALGEFGVRPVADLPDAR